MIGLKKKPETESGIQKKPETESGIQNELLVQTGMQAGFGRISPRATTLQLQNIYLDHEKKNEKM